jgi:hypothetical protein
MFLRAKSRFQDGKEHRYWSIVESHRTMGNKIVQRQVLYLGEINDSQKASWCKTMEVFQHGEMQGKQIALFPADRKAPELPCEVVQIRLDGLELRRPPDNGVHVGWHAICGTCLNSTTFGYPSCRQAVRKRVGSTF